MIFSKNRGLINDSVSDLLTRIRNATLAKKGSVKIPFTNLNRRVVRILEKEGFIQNFQLSVQSNNLIISLKYYSKKLYHGRRKESCITNLRRISKSGLRIYANYREIPRILGGAGIVIISTPEGVMTDREARARKLGGELICSVW